MAYKGTMVALFDTLAFTRKLTESGMERGQSEAIASAVHDAVRGSVATQQDLVAVRNDLADVRHGLEIKIEAVNTKVLVLQWMTGAIVTGVLALVAKAFFLVP